MSQADIDAQGVNFADPVDVAIAAGQSLSGPVNLSGRILSGMIMPAAWDAAALTFMVSGDAGTSWLDLYDATGQPVTVQAGANRAITVFSNDWLIWRWLKVRSGTAATPVAQSAARSIRFTLAR